VTSIRTAALLLLVFMGFLSLGQQASAQEGPSAWPEWTCADFPEGVEAAIAYFNEFGGPDSLDSNQDGIACNEGDGPSAWPEWTCDDFPGTSEEAIAYYETNGGPATLDPNGDGIACNEGADPDPDHGPSAWPNWSCHTFPDGWDAAIDYYTTNGGPGSLDADGDGFPCESNGDDDITECRDLGGPQHIAQDYFDANGQPRNLDLDQDGLACMNEVDGYWGDTPVRPASLPNEDDDTTTGDAEPADGTDASDAVATDASSGSAAPETPETPGATSATVSQLPSTGSVPSDAASFPLDLLAGGVFLTIIATWLALRGHRQTI
jgi:hypothetical protein